ncbi:MAG: hypothetical protein LBP76_11045 [Treponema sp.]|jgi:hypothetical protein|nr:hypothetical protein [Treponema sp.]
MKPVKKLCIILLISFTFIACASSNPHVTVDSAVDRGDFNESIAELESNKDKVYSNKDAILYYLDKGMLSHYAARYDESSQLLQDGERAIEEAFTKSITQGIGTYLVNDKVRDYDGEDYENIYLNAFNALNYYHRNDMENAKVEIRRMSEKLRDLAVKYDQVRSNIQEAALAEGGEIPPDPNSSTKFSDSALARYLGMLFFRNESNIDDARIYRDDLKVAFANAPEVYNYALPVSIDEELTIPSGKARLNVIGFGGLGPVKQEEVIRIPITEGNWIKIALPVLTTRPSNISRVEVVLNNGQSFDLELLEDMEAVARETFKEKKGIIYLKSVLRATVKGTTSAALGAAGNNTEDDNTGLALGLLSLATQVYAEASEQADLRLARYFPSGAYIGGINLDPGVYSLTIKYYDKSGKVLDSFDRNNVEVKENTLNLTEAICLK